MSNVIPLLRATARDPRADFHAARRAMIQAFAALDAGELEKRLMAEETARAMRDVAGMGDGA